MRARLGESAQPIVAPDTPAELFGRLAEWMGSFDDALSALNDHHETVAAASLVGVIAHFCDIRAQVSTAKRLRPWMASWNTLDQSVSAAERVIMTSIETLEAVTPLEAQRLAVLLQHHLDEGASVATTLSEKIDQFAGIPSANPRCDDLIALAEAAFSATRARDLVEFEKRGAALASRITDGAVPDGLGLALALKETVANAMFDVARFDRVAAEVCRFFVADPNRLRKLATSPYWLEDSALAGQAGRDAAATVDALMAAAWNERLEARALIGFGHALVEGPGAYVLASLATFTGRRDYGIARQSDTGVLLQQLDQIGFSGWIDGLEVSIRNAHAHDDWQLRPDGMVELHPGKPGARVTSLPELLDLVIRGAESLLAIDTGLGFAAAAIGVDYTTVDWRQALDIQPADAVRLMLTMAGWVGTEATLEGDHLGVTATASRSNFSIGTIGALASVVADDITSFTLSVDVDDGTHQTLTGPAAALRWVRDAEGETAKGVAMVEFLHSVQLNGEPMAGVDLVRRWSTVPIGSALTSPLRPAIATLRRIRDPGGQNWRRRTRRLGNRRDGAHAPTFDWSGRPRTPLGGARAYRDLGAP
jgi:hypothetical protein